MNEMDDVSRREIKERLEQEAQDRQIANAIARRVLKNVGIVGQEIPATGRWSRGITTPRAIEIAQQDLVEQGIITHVEDRTDAIDSYEHAQHMGDQPLPYPVFVIDELDDTKRKTRRRDKR